MTRPKAILIVSGMLVIVGMLISFSQSETEVNDLATSQQDLPAGAPMNVTKILDPAQSKGGVYSIQISDFKNGDTVSASVVDPNGDPIITRSITKSPFQENFTISSNGTYELKIQNTAQEEMQVLGIIGYYPKGPALIDLASIIILIIGLSGLAIGMMYFIKRRGKV